jgi:hypothetical protein
MRDNPYSTSTVDTPSCKQLVCGRRDDVKEILRLLAEGKSVALFGERRIGKTLTVLLIRDIINKSIRSYQQELWDDDLRVWLASLETSASPINRLPAACQYVTLHDLSKKSIDGIVDELHKTFPPPAGKPESLQQLFSRLNAGRTARLVIVFEEMETLFDPRFKQADLVFRQLRSAIQACDQISFLFSGAEHWVRAVMDGTSRLAGNCAPVFLSIPEVATLQKYLLQIPLKAYIPSDLERENISSRIVQESGGKPFYCQAIAQEIAYGKPIDEALQEVKKGYIRQIEDFFDNPPVPGPDILCLLAHRPGISAKRLAAFLNLPKQKTTLAISDMEALGKIRVANGEYYLNGKLFESWGRTNLAPPATSPLWRKRLRVMAAAAALVFVIAAVYIYVYTHPWPREYELPIRGGTVVLMLPSSVESGETGNASIYVDAGTDSLAGLVISPMADSARHVARIWPKTETAWTFSNLVPNQTSDKKSAEFAIPHGVKGDSIAFKLLLNQAIPLESQIPLRRFPLKAYWAIISGVAAFFTMASAALEIVFRFLARPKIK